MSDDVTVIPTMINGRWLLQLPEHRAVRPEWPVWEKERLAAMHSVITAMASRPRRVMTMDGNRGRLTDPPMVYDIGAEEGDLPALWATWGAAVALFEPNERVWPNIRVIWEANHLPPPLYTFTGFAGPVTYVPEGRFAWDALAQPDGWPACANGPVIGDHGFLNLCERPDVPAITLDDAAGQMGRRPDVITVDVEGAEVEVMDGAHQILAEARPVVFISVHPEFMDAMYGRHPNDLHQLMLDHGYHGELLAVDHEHHWKFTHPENPW